MPITEFPIDLGAVNANESGVIDIETTFRGNASVPDTARIVYAIIRNASGGTITVNPNRGASILSIGVVKKIVFQVPVRQFVWVPTATTTAGQVTADVGVEGCRF